MNIYKLIAIFNIFCIIFIFSQLVFSTQILEINPPLKIMNFDKGKSVEYRKKLIGIIENIDERGIVICDHFFKLSIKEKKFCNKKILQRFKKGDKVVYILNESMEIEEITKYPDNFFEN